MITVNKITRLEEFEGLRPLWNQLLRQNDIDRVFLTFEWLSIWWNVFGGGKRSLYILAVKSDDTLIGLAPLMLTTDGSSKIIEFIGTPNIDYADIIGIEKETVIESILRYFADHKSEWTKIKLEQIPENASTLQILKTSMGSKTGLSRIQEIETCHMLVYNGNPENLPNFTVKRPRSVRSALKIFEKTGGPVMERITDRELVERNLYAFFQFHINRWDDTSTPSKFLQEEHRRFYFELARQFGASGNLFFSCVRNGELPLAYCFGFEYDGIINYVTMTINSYYSKYSPGQLLFALQAEKYIREGYILDYSRGEQSYKDALTNVVTTNYLFTMYANAAGYSRDKTWEKIKSRPLVAKRLSNKNLQDFKARLFSNGDRLGGGFARRIFRFAGEPIRQLVSYDKLRILTIEQNSHIVKGSGDDIEICQVGKEKIDLIGSFYGFRGESEQYNALLRRFENQADCHVAFYKGQIAAISWGLFSADSFSAHDLWPKLRQGQVLINDVVVSPLYKDVKILPALLNHQIDFYRQKGLQVLMAVGSEQKFLKEALKDFKSSRIKTMGRLKLFGKRIL